MIDDSELKCRFIELLKSGEEPEDAAMILEPDDSFKALQMVTEWTKDSDVINAMNPIKNLPNKTKFGRYIWKRMELADDKEAALFAKLYAEINGFIEKPQTNINLDNSANVGDRLVDVSKINSAADAEKVYNRLINERN